MKIFIPLHISGFWIPYITSDPLLSGSVGAGIALEPKVVGTLGSGKGLIFNGRQLRFPPLRTLERFIRGEIIDVEVHSKAPLGLGFGVSAALLIASAFISLKRIGYLDPVDKAFKIAHISEVLNRTGLGDVISEKVGKGLVVRTRPGPPGIGDAYALDIKEDLRVITAPINNITTPEMLAMLSGKSIICGKEAFSNFIRKDQTFEAFLSSAEKFSKCTGLMKNKMAELLTGSLKHCLKIGCISGLFIKKSLLIVVVERSCTLEVKNTIGKMFNEVKSFKISGSGVTVKK